MTLEFDPCFAKVLEAKGYVPDAGNITIEDVKNIRKLNVSFCSLQSLKGIEYFESLENLTCDMNHLTSLDISKNVALTHLVCTANPLPSLDISNNIALEILYCDCNKLTSLDTSNNIALTILKCNGNKINTLDISNNRELKLLYCYHNKGVNGKFIVKAWFDNNNIPADDFGQHFQKDSWGYPILFSKDASTTVNIEYHNVVED